MARKINPLPAFERLQELFEYDRKTGLLRWRITHGTAKAGSPAGWRHRTGYLYVGVDGVSYKVHRIIWALCHQKAPADLLDHIDRNPANNRIENLREATHAQNQQNKRTYANNLSGVKGVSWYRNRNMWRVRIQHNGVSILIGMFKTFEDACKAREQAQQRLHTHA